MIRWKTEKWHEKRTTSSLVGRKSYKRRDAAIDEHKKNPVRGKIK